MLNPDGVLQGNHRCSMAGEDLNRKWAAPCPQLHPIIYATKGLLMLLSRSGRVPLVYADFHGHSRKKNVFMYGCSAAQSWLLEDTENPAWVDARTEDQAYQCLPRILERISQAFSLSNCSYQVDKTKESTARVVVWRQCRVLRSYTVESTYHGCDQGELRGLHLNTSDLERVGACFAEALLQLRNQCSPVLAGKELRGGGGGGGASSKPGAGSFDLVALFSDLDLPDDEDDVGQEDELDVELHENEDEDDEELLWQTAEIGTAVAERSRSTLASSWWLTV